MNSKLSFEINNGGKMELVQNKHDQPVKVKWFDDEMEISPQDFVTLLNWYQYQKAKGNTNLFY